MKLKISHRRKIGNFTNACKLKTLLNSQWIKEEIKREVKKYFETNRNGNTT